jgi:hypothetical protein
MIMGGGKMRQSMKIPLGIKLIIAFHLVNIVLWTIGQGGAVVSYDTIASWGLQDARGLLDPAIVEVNRGIGAADMIAIMPLFIVALIGLWRLRFYGAAASWMAFGFSIYWPVIFWASQYFYGQAGIKHQPTQIQGYVIPGIILGFALWASWYLLRKREVFD